MLNLQAFPLGLSLAARHWLWPDNRKYDYLLLYPNHNLTVQRASNLKTCTILQSLWLKVQCQSIVLAVHADMALE